MTTSSAAGGDLPDADSSAALRDLGTGLHGVAVLRGRPVRAPDGERIGRIDDIVVRETADEYPPVTGIVVRIGRRRSFVPMRHVDHLDADGATLAVANIDLRSFARRDDELALGRDVIDHQLVDIDGARVVRAADVVVAEIDGDLRAVGVDVGFTTVLARIGGHRAAARTRPRRLVDWADMQPFGHHGGVVQLRTGVRSLQRLHPGELADLIEDLGRRERRALIGAFDPDVAADVLEAMDAHVVEGILRDLPAVQAAGLLAGMEPDEAVEALRDLGEERREAVFAAMPPDAVDRLRGLLAFPAATAGGLMTPHLVLARRDDTVADVRARLQTEAAHHADIVAVLVVDDDRVLIDDITIYELFVAEPDIRLADLCRPPWPVTVEPQASLDAVVARFRTSRDTSLIVVDAAGHPIGRVLADDVVDLLAGRRS